MVARPPTSAVLGRSDRPARRTAGVLFILAADTREFRPTVWTASLNLSWGVPPVSVAPRAAAARDAVTDVDCMVVSRVAVDETTARDGTAVRDAVTFDGAATVVRGAAPVFVSVTADTVAVARDDATPSLSVAGTAREIAPVAPNAAGTQIFNAKKHVNSFCIPCLNYITSR